MRTIIALAVLILLGTSAVAGECRVASSGRVAHDALDGEQETLGGEGSAVEVTGDGQTIVMLSDRGPDDGKMEFRPRLHFFRLDRDDKNLRPVLQRTVIFRDSEGRAMTGLIPDAHDEAVPRMLDGRLCLDPEGLALAPDGRVFVSEEYMPSVCEFGLDGKLVRRFEVPGELLPRTKKGTDFGNDEKDDIVSGRQPNRGFEGLAFGSDGKLYALLQGGSAQDGGRNAGFTRMFVFDPATAKPVAAYKVPFADAKDLADSLPPGKELKQKHLVFSSLAQLPDGRFLALERDDFGADGSEECDAARYKAVVLLDASDAENILGAADASGARPVKRTVLFNLANLDTASCGLPRTEMPAKWEGLGIVKAESDRLTLLLSSDNDFMTPALALRNASGEASSIPFSKARKPQDTWLVEVECPLPAK